ncbi:hypothetical protein B0H13DRAFT_2155217, partial [Mycena leptocephala]
MVDIDMDETKAAEAVGKADVSDNAEPGEVTEEDAIALCDPKMLDIDDACAVEDAADSCDTTEGLSLCDPKMLDIDIEEVKEAASEDAGEDTEDALDSTETDGIIPENDPVDVVRAEAEGTAPVFIEALCDANADPCVEDKGAPLELGTACDATLIDILEIDAAVDECLVAEVIVDPCPKPVCLAPLLVLCLEAEEGLGEVVALAVRAEEDLLKLLAFAWDVATLLVLCVEVICAAVDGLVALGSCLCVEAVDDLVVLDLCVDEGLADGLV